MLASQIYNLHFPGSLITQHKTAINFTVPFPFYIYLILKVEVLYITSAFNFFFLVWAEGKGKAMFFTVLPISILSFIFVQVCAGCSWHCFRFSGSKSATN